MDFGTSSLKLAVLDEHCNILETVKESYNLYIPCTNWIEIKPEDIIHAMLSALKKLTTDLKSIEGLCYDTFSPSVIFMNKEGHPCYPIITHLDRRSINESNFICKHFGTSSFHNLTGTLPFPGGTSLTSIFWFKNNSKDIFDRTYKIGHLNTFIHKYLTGLWGIDTVNASMTGMYSTIKNDGWSDDILKMISLSREKLPDILKPGKSFGILNNQEIFSLGIKKGIPVSMGTNDIAAAQIGADNNSGGDILQVSGSSDMISILTDKPVTIQSYYLRCSANKDLWQIFAITSSGFALEWIRKELFREIDIDVFYSEKIKKALQAGPNNVIYHPYISGDRQSLEIKKGIFEGIELDTTRENILASMIKGFHVPIISTLETAENFVTLNKTIKCTGGLSKNENIINYKKKIFNKYDIQVVDECPLIGNVKLWIEKNTKADVNTV